MKFFKCKKCGKVVEIIERGCPVLFCCDERMEEIIPNTSDAAKEKHVPVYSVNDDKVYVKVGEVSHPMEENHYITHIIIETGNTIIRKNLKPSDLPEAVFDFEKGMKVYAFCNLHGLWMTEIKE